MGLLLELAKGTQRELAGKEKVEDKGWGFRDGIIIFPETRCPFCKEVVKSKAIWSVDNKAHKLLGQAVPVAGTKFKLDVPCHPHVFPRESGRSGGTCMGNAPDMITALFGAYNPSSLANSSQTVSKWLAGKYWGHECDKVVKCYRCHNETSTLEREWKGRNYCGQCWMYEIGPLKAAEEAAAKKAEAAKAKLEEAAARKKGQAPRGGAGVMTLAALTGQAQEAKPEIPGFRFMGAGEGVQVVVMPVDGTGVEVVVRCERCNHRPCDCRECSNCGRMVAARDIMDCDAHPGMCQDCHADI